ncbi:MAG: FAD-dependent oxidoreductase [Chromatocurvus sp.]
MTQPHHASLWTATADVPTFPPLAGGAETDVLVIGAGIVGLTLADLLKRAGRSVVLIEAKRIGAQVTGRSTAKLTALQGLAYSQILEKHNLAAARSYAQAHSQAIEYVATRATEAGIECDLRREPAFTVSEAPDGMRRIHAEARAARDAGLAAEVVDSVPLPFPVAGAVRLDNQIAFHPQRYLAGLAHLVHGNAGQIFEQTRALSVEECRPSKVVTDRGTIRARDVVVTTHIPFLDRGLFFTKAFPRQHTVIAARIPEDKVPGGMCLAIDEPGWSVRSFHDDQGPILIATGTGNRPGHTDTLNEARRLETFARERFGATEVLYRWTNQDYDSMDRLPYVGRMPGLDRVWLATGFSAWGLSGGTAAAQLLADLLEGRRGELATHWDARRWNLRKVGRDFLSTNLHAGKEMISDRLNARHAPPADELAPGQGGVVRHQGGVVAAWRDESGTLTTFSANCTHLGCLVSWDPLEQVWLCPCHGSVFDRQGRVVHGPAVRDLKRL